MKKIFLIKCVLAFLLLIAIYPQLSYSCNCAESLEIKNQAKLADVITVGKVVKMENIYILDTLGPNFVDTIRIKIIYFKITSILKGDLEKNSIIKVYTASNSDECGYGFKKGKKYILYSSLKTSLPFGRIQLSPFYYTSRCYRNKIFSETELKSLKEALKLIKNST